jgi:hypothetical protein
LVAHGQWTSWLRTWCPDISVRLAQAYLQIHRDWSALESVATRNGVAVFELSLRGALASLRRGDELAEGGTGRSPLPEPAVQPDLSRYTHTVRLFFDALQYAEFRGHCARLKQRFEADNDSDALLALLRSQA